MKRRMKEKWTHKDAFESYLLMGPSRSFGELANRTGFAVTTLSRWNKEFGWAERVAMRDEKVMAQVQDDNDEIYLREVKLRHQKAYKDVQEKAMRQIAKKKLSFDSDKDAAIALDIGIKGERDVLGLRDSKMKAMMQKDGFAALVEIVSGS